MLEKVGGNGNPMLSEQIVAIADNFLEYECLATNQHQNFVSAFTKKDQFVEKKILYCGLDSLDILYLYPCLSSSLFNNK